MSEYWQTELGLIVPKDGANRHHVIWDRVDYKTPTEKSFRTIRGFVLRLFLPPHAELHHEVPPPPKVSPSLMSEVIKNNKHVPDTVPFAHYVQFNNICNYLEEFTVNTHSDRLAEEADSLVENLRQQQYFIEIGKVALINIDFELDEIASPQT